MSNSFLKIALFTYSTKPRGSVIHTLELAQALVQLGHQVCIYALDKDGSGFDYPLSCSYQPILALEAPFEIDLLIQQRINEFIDFLSQSELDYDIYHAQDCLSANALAYLKSQGKISHFIRTVHHIEEFSNIYLQECQLRSILQADLCFAVSSQWKQVLHEDYQIEAVQVFNGVNTNRFSQVNNGTEDSLKARLGIKGYPVYLTVGGIEPRKNSITLLQAFAQLLKEYPNAQLIIAGGATLFDYHRYRDEFFVLVNQLELTIGKSLILPGVVSEKELSGLYRIADVFVFPSLKEGWGLVILEAISCGLAVITLRQPPFTEFLTDKQALLVDVNSAETIAQAMTAILDSELNRNLLKNSKSVISKYSWEASAKIHIEQYYQFLLAHA
ncbi:MAG: MSMEG_0565 family glycosyltransferase [Cyanobacteriota bacterium ELA615]